MESGEFAHERAVLNVLDQRRTVRVRVDGRRSRRSGPSCGSRRNPDRTAKVRRAATGRGKLRALMCLSVGDRELRRQPCRDRLDDVELRSCVFLAVTGI